MATANNSSSFIAFEEELRCLEHLPLGELLRMQRNVQMISNATEVEREGPAEGRDEQPDDVVSARRFGGRIRDYFIGDGKGNANSPMLTPSPFVLNK